MSNKAWVFKLAFKAHYWSLSRNFSILGSMGVRPEKAHLLGRERKSLKTTVIKNASNFQLNL